jgi:hypothetical protein
MSNSQQPATISQHRMVVARLMPRPILSIRRGIEPRRRSARAGKYALRIGGWLLVVDCWTLPTRQKSCS